MNRIPLIETQPLSAIRQFQFRKLQETVQYLQLNSPFYKRLFRKYNVSCLDSWQHFEAIPTTSKDDLQKHNWEFLCVPRDELVEYTTTSGTLGKPVTIGLTLGDVRRLAYNESLSFACAEGSSKDLYQLILTLDRQFMAGMAYYEGIRQLGAGLIRTGTGLPAMQWQTIEQLKPTALVVVPSFLVKLIAYAVENGIDVRQSSVKKAICIGEPIRLEDLTLNALGKRIVEQWNIDLFGTYASTEMQTAFTECKCGNGGHQHPELIYVEILDAEERSVKPGETGEVVITTLGIEGMPLLRYKTGDKARVLEEPCKCGRTTPRIGPIIGRTQHMIKLKGTTLYPSAIFECLHRVSTVKDYVVEVFSDELNLDVLKIKVSSDEMSQHNTLQELRSVFKSSMRVTPLIEFVSEAEIERLQRKTPGRKLRKFIDQRFPVR